LRAKSDAPPSHAHTHTLCLTRARAPCSDETEFTPAKQARDGGVYTPEAIPDGFYLVGDSTSKEAQHAWHTAMIDAVRAVTHIAPADDKGQLLGDPVTQEGVVVFPVRSLFLCSSVTSAPFATTTEVYPDSPKTNDDECNRAQVACIVGGLDYVLAARAK
jgi:hypothetical protein